MNPISRRRFLKQTLLPLITAACSPIAQTVKALAADHSLKITAVEPCLLKGNKCFVLVRTTEGITGIGEISPMNPALSARLLSETFAPLLIGMNPLDVQVCWEKVYYRTYKQGVMGLQPETLAGVDIALWDLLGKVAGLPICRLLGGPRRESVRLYSSIGGGGTASIAEMARQAEDAVRDGFTAVKIRMDYGPIPPDRDVKRDLEMLRTVRSAIGPDVELQYDVNNGYSTQTAIRVGKAIEEFNVIHYEEPVAQTDYQGYAEVVRSVDIPVAAGEHEYTLWQFRDLIENANPDILQPDLVKCAGISEAVRIAALASAYHKKLVPHQTQPTIGEAANLHFTSVFVTDDTAQEMSHGGLKSELHSLFTNPLEFKDGRMAVPSGPGLGLDLDENRLREMMI